MAQNKGAKRICLEMSTVEGNEEKSSINCTTPPPIMTEDDDDNNFVDQKTNEVFENDMLREIILGFVIKNDDGSTSREGACLARLVQKAWQRDVNRQLFKTHRALFRLKLSEKNSLNESPYVQAHGKKLLDHFVATMESSVDSIVPSFRLDISKEFFCDENHQSFSRFLRSSVCSSGLQLLNFYVPANGGSITLMMLPESVLFSRLKFLHVHFCREGPPPTQVENNVVGMSNGSNSYFIPFLQFVLSKAVGLFEFSLSGDSGCVVPAGIKHLTLPRSLNRLFWNTVLDKEKLEMLAGNSLAQLTFLCLNVGDLPIPDADTLLFQILDNVKSTLRHLKFSREKRSFSQESVKYLRFPVMKCLELCQLDSINVQLQNQNAPLTTLVPKLRQLRIIYHTRDSLRHWTNDLCFPNVTDLSIMWQVDCYHTSVTTEKVMQAICKAFPNITGFGLFTHSCSRTCRDIVHCVFKNMTQLTSLFFVFTMGNLENSHYWDSLLCGIPVSAAAALSASPELWKYIELKERPDRPSIKNLTLLKTLALSTEEGASDFPPLISDLSFYHAFNKMPTLKAIKLSGRFANS